MSEAVYLVSLNDPYQTASFGKGLAFPVEEFVLALSSSSPGPAKL